MNKTSWLEDEKRAYSALRRLEDVFCWLLFRFFSVAPASSSNSSSMSPSESDIVAKGCGRKEEREVDIVWRTEPLVAGPTGHQDLGVIRS